MNLDTSETLLANASNLLEESIGKLKQLQDEPENLETRNSEFKARCVYQVSFIGFSSFSLFSRKHKPFVSLNGRFDIFILF